MKEEHGLADASAWELPGSAAGRRAAIWGTATRVAARYATARLRGGAGSFERAHSLGARDLYRTAVRLRGGFLKLGQFVSARPDLLPEVYVTELSKLQDRVPPAPAAVTAGVISEDVGPVGDHFECFDTEWASAASLAQVHSAVRRDGRRVAVKVQYPKVAEIVPREARDTRRVLGLVAKAVPGLDLRTIGHVLEHTIVSELDYAAEAANIERFADNFADEESISCPRVHHDITRGRVLVMDWVDGDNLALALRTADRAVAEEASRILVDAYLKQILVDGFVHADPHPGNFLLQPGPRLGIVDFGAVARLSEPTRAGIRHLYAAALRSDTGAIAEALDLLGFRTRSGDLGSLAAWAGLFSFEDVSADREAAWKRLMAARRDNPLTKLPDELILVGRVLIVQTGLVARIAPSWRLADLVERWLEVPTT